MAVSKPIATFVPAIEALLEPRLAKAIGLKSMDAQTLMAAAANGLSWQSVRRFLDLTRLTQQELVSYLEMSENFRTPAGSGSL